MLNSLDQYFLTCPEKLSPIPPGTTWGELLVRYVEYEGLYEQCFNSVQRAKTFIREYLAGFPEKAQVPVR